MVVYGRMQRYCLRPAGTALRPFITALCIYGHHIRFWEMMDVQDAATSIENTSMASKSVGLTQLVSGSAGNQVKVLSS